MAKHRKLSVCIVIPKLFLTEKGVIVGGAAVSALNLTRGLVDAGIKVHLLAGIKKDHHKYLSNMGFLRQILYPCTMKYKRHTYVKTLFIINKLMSAAKEIYRKDPFNIIHTHSGFWPYALISGRVAHMTNTLAFHTLYCPLKKQKGRYSSWLNLVLVKYLCLKRMDRIVAISNNVADSIHKTGINNENVSVIGPAIDTNRFTPRPSSLYASLIKKKFRDNKILLFVGNTNPDKGLDLLLISVRNLLDAGYQVGLVACTENLNSSKETESYNNHINKIIDRSKLENHVLRLGIIPDIENLYTCCDVLVAPFRSTQGPSDYPLAILEAMASGLPVVATYVGGIPEIVAEENAGYLVSKVTAEDITDSIMHALDNSEVLRPVAEKAREFVVRNFSMANVANNYIEMYNQLL